MTFPPSLVSTHFAAQLARRQSRLLDALRSLCEEHGVAVNVSPAALSSCVSTSKDPVEPTNTGASSSTGRLKSKVMVAAIGAALPTTYLAHDSCIPPILTLSSCVRPLKPKPFRNAFTVTTSSGLYSETETSLVSSTPRADYS